ncbi:MAG TPA: DUF2171 domain-containing protein [Dehalococcoidia bacterium]|nr:DUF2171 domain-containing protein [Dehalococcoidia bacterium]
MNTYRGNASVGLRVMSADGHDLGTVAQVAGTCFRVEVDGREDYWLGADAVASTSGAGIRLNLTEAAATRPAPDDLPHHGCHWHG